MELVHIRAQGGAIEAVAGINIERQISQGRITELGVAQWADWKNDDSDLTDDTATWPVTYADPEGIYLVEGSVEVTAEDDHAAISVNAGDFVAFPAGATFIWKTAGSVHLKRGIRLPNGKFVRPLEWR